MDNPKIAFYRYESVPVGRHDLNGTHPLREEVFVNLIVFLLVVFLIALVAGWGWRMARGR